ncbi:MAG: response regulator [Salinirussus sp.]
MAEVLVAHDSPFLRSLLRSVVEIEHDIVGEGKNGVEAVESSRSLDPDVVILAVSMPIQDGIDAAATIRDREPSVGIVLCLDADGDHRPEATVEADEVLTVPFRRSGVLEAVARSACA